MMSVTPVELTLDPDDGGDPIDLYGSDEFGVTRLSLGAPDVRDDVRLRSGASGGIDRTTLFGGRVVTMDLNSDVAGGDFARLVASTSPSRRPTLTFRRDGETSRRMLLSGRPRDIPMTSLGSLETQLQWFAADGTVEEADLSEVTVTAEQPSAGRTYPRLYPLTYAPGGSTGQVTVINAGEEPTWPTIRVDGPAAGVTLHNDTTGRQIGLDDGYEIPDGQYAIFDMAARQIYLNGDRTASLIGFFLDPGGEFWALEPGLNVVRFSPFSATAPAAATVEWRGAWLW